MKYSFVDLFPALSSVTEQHLQRHILLEHETADIGSDV